jgi:choline dehydrogenase-like flavoprotein
MAGGVPIPSSGVSAAERWLRGILIAHAVWSAVLALGYIVQGDTTTFAFIPNSFAKDVLFVILSALAAADLRRFGALALVIAAGYLALVVGQIAVLVIGGAEPIDVPLIGEVSATAALLGWLVADVVLAVLFAWLWFAAAKAAYGLRYLDPLAFLTLAALAEVLIEGEREVIPPREVARNVDGYLADLESTGKGRVRTALIVLGLWPLLTARPPLATLAPDTRKAFLKKRFVDEIVERRVWAPLRQVVQALIRTGSQMSYLGYYGDRRSWASIGYTTYAHRPGGRRPEPADALAPPPLRTLVEPPRQRYDTVVIGSGAAGGILAYRFAESGRRVLVLERGPHVDPRQFTDDEVAQYLRLYNEGALQLAANFSLQVLQGMCVGGGTTINNALCLPPPELVLEAWEPHGLDRAGLREAIEEVRAWFEVAPIRDATTTAAAKRFHAAAAELGLPGELEVMEANISVACRGTGYCNIGCGYGAKLSTLDMVLPLAQQRFGLELMADVRVEQVECQGARAVRVVGRHGPSGARVAVEADEIVVAAGAIGSSSLLERSGFGGDAVGRDLHFNINSPLAADFPEPVDSFAGIQMSHAYRAPGGVPDYLVETWFNPPATQALAMPGWFDRHFENMLRYRHMACAGVLAGTTTPGRVKDGRIEFDASPEDRQRVVDGLQVAGRIWLHAGAERVMPATFGWQEYRTPESLAELPRRILQTGDLLLTSAHPQGGNALGAVVDEEFRVRGMENLYVCDASVFPSSVHVNPQLTVMGLAQYAARRIVGARAGNDHAVIA